MARHWITIFLFSMLSCVNKTQQQEWKTVYDEVALKDFVLASADPDRSKSITLLDSILGNALLDSVVFYQTVDFLGKQFSDPNSPYRNESLEAKLLNAELGSKWFGVAEKHQASSTLKLLLQNNVGSLSKDFSYVTPGRDRRKMYDLKSKYTLILFYNPECNACKDTKSALFNSKILNDKIKDGELKILAVYTDNDERSWMKHLTEMPKSWLNGRDENEYLYKNKIYDLRAIPSIYLLDQNKKVLLKDCMSVSEIENNLE